MKKNVLIFFIFFNQTLYEGLSKRVKSDAMKSILIKLCCREYKTKNVLSVVKIRQKYVDN